MYRPALTASTATAVLAAVGITAAALLATTASFFTVAGAQTTSNDTNVTLSVAEETSVTVTPDLFDFASMTLGETNFSDIQPLRLQIENTGTTNLTNIYANPDTISSEQDNPLGTGQPAEYAAGRFLWISNTSDNAFGFYHAGHLTWNNTEDNGGEPSGITNDPANTVGHGFYRNATGDYLWAIQNDTSNIGCDETGASLTIKTAKDDGSNRDMSANTVTYNVQTQNANWGLAGTGSNPTEPVSSGPLQGHYVALHSSCEKAYAFRWDDPSAIPDPDGTGSTPVNELVGPSSSDHITPGEVWVARIGAAVHAGVPDGSTNRTLLTITASAQ